MVHELHCCFENCLLGDKHASRTDSTVRTYCYNLCWVAARMDGFTEEDVPSPEAVIGYCERNDVPSNRRQLTYSSMKVLHNARNEPELSKKYAIPLVDARRALHAKYKKQRRTKQQAANWLEFKCIKHCAEELRKSTFALDKGAPWTKDNFARAQLALVLTFHLRYPLRRDLCSVVYAGDGPNRLEKKEIILTDHKNKRWVPEYRFKLDRNAWRLVQLLKKQHKIRNLEPGNLLLNRYWRPMKANAFTNWMKREMGKLPECEGKAVGCLSLRHSIITHRRRNDSTLDQREEFARCCMHSASTNELYRIH